MFSYLKSVADAFLGTADAKPSIFIVCAAAIALAAGIVLGFKNRKNIIYKIKSVFSKLKNSGYEDAGIIAGLGTSAMLNGLNALKNDKAPVSDDFEAAGFAYEPEQDIFISQQDAWQRKFGYCSLYDDMAAEMAMIFNCEPIRFEYGGKRWLIEVWKGQYGMTTGAEIGVYVSADETYAMGQYDGTFYRAAEDDQRLNMAFKAYKNEKELFSRNERHWWLTAFKLGMYSEPEELTMEVSLELLDEQMSEACAAALLELGYSQMSVNKKTVKFLFDKPYSKQPASQSSIIATAMKRQNSELCKLYNNLTKDIEDPQEKLEVFKQKAPTQYGGLLAALDAQEYMKMYETIQFGIKR